MAEIARKGRLIIHTVSKNDIDFSLKSSLKYLNNCNIIDTFSKIALWSVRKNPTLKRDSTINQKIIFPFNLNPDSIPSQIKNYMASLKSFSASLNETFSIDFPFVNNIKLLVPSLQNSCVILYVHNDILKSTGDLLYELISRQNDSLKLRIFPVESKKSQIPLILENLVALGNSKKSNALSLKERAEVVLTSCDKNDLRSFEMISRKLSDFVDVSCSVLTEKGDFVKIEKEFMVFGDLDEDAQIVVKDMIDYVKIFEIANNAKSSELAKFWQRKTKQAVLSILMTRKPNEPARIFRGINVEASLPSGALCAERTAFGSALSADPSLARADFKMIAVCAISLSPLRSDENPISPCGLCKEWIKKIIAENPLFRVITFKSSACDQIVQEYLPL